MNRKAAELPHTAWLLIFALSAASGCTRSVGTDVNDESARFEACDPAGDELCVPDCDHANCTPEQQQKASCQPPQPSAAKHVPSCPMPALGAPPPFFLVKAVDYEGPATVSAIGTADPGWQTLLLTSDAAQGASFEVKFRGGELPGFLFVGRNVDVFARAGGSGSQNYRLLVVHDSNGKLLLAIHAGADHLFRDGMFNTGDVIGASVQLTRICEDTAGDCFEHQVQAVFSATFAADSTVTLDNGKRANLSIAQAAYETYFSGGSVEGGAARNCPAEITPGRYLDFTLLAR